MARDRRLAAIRELRARHSHMASAKRPRVGQVLEIDGADVDLFEEESYLDELVTAFLSNKSAQFTAILLNPSIDRRIAAASPKTPEQEFALKSILTYRRQVSKLARLLSKASGVPIRERNSN